MEIAPAEPADHDELVEVVVRRQPHADRPMLEEQVRGEFLDTDRVVLVAREHGEVVGAGFAGHPRPAAPNLRAIRVVVAQGHEGGGLGRRLYDELRSRLPQTDALLRAQGFDGDPRSLAIAEHWGFTVSDEHVASTYDLTQPFASPTLPDGVTAEGSADLDFPDRDDVEAMLERSQTNPEREFMLLTLDSLRGWALDHGAGVLLRVDGRPAAITWAGINEPVAHVVYTGVDPAYRGRDLAALAKQQLHVDLRRAGLTSAVTENEKSNLGIRRLNERLGYVVEFGWYGMHQQL